MLKKLFPFLRWFPMPRNELRADLIAGLTVALVLIPQSMAYAELAGLPPWVGLYAAFLPVIIGGLWGSSNHLQTGPVAMIALLTASVLAPLAVAGSVEYTVLAAKLALLVGGLWALVTVLRLTFIINFLSRPVIEGFVHAGALIIAASQLGKILGIEMVQGTHYLTDLFIMLSQLGDLHVPSLLIGGGALFLLILGHRFFPRIPTALLVVVAGTAVVYFFGLSDADRAGGPMAIVGAVPSGLPKPVWAVPGIGDVFRLLPGALIIALVGFMEMASVARALAARSRQKLNLNQEMAGQTLASIGSAFAGGFPVSGSFSRSALNFASGAKSGLSAVFTGLFVMIFLLFFTRFLHYLPKSVLAAIIMSAVLRLINFKQLWHYMQVNKADGIAAFGTFGATLLFAPHLEKGIILGASISIFIHLYRMMRPHVALLGLHPDGAMRDADLHNLEIDPNLPAIRLDGRLFFANASYFEESVYAVCERFPQARYVVVVCNGINEIDASGTEMLKDVASQLKANDVQLLFVGVKNQVKDVMRVSGLDREVGEENFFGTFEHARSEIYARLPSDITYAI
ncbi:MAG: SulP family inorganic anion transporter [Pontiella sp.]